MLRNPITARPARPRSAATPAVRRRALLGLCLLGPCLLGLGCTQLQSAPQAPARAAGSEVIFHPSSGGSPWRVKVELARTPDELMRGLMYRRSLGADEGMLFLFPRAELRRFWMRNTYIPLDMVFLDSNRVVVGIEENAVPLDETSRGPDTPAQYVVEVRGGLARQHGLGIGARAEFRSVE